MQNEIQFTIQNEKWYIFKLFVFEPTMQNFIWTSHLNIKYEI